MIKVEIKGNGATAVDVGLAAHNFSFGCTMMEIAGVDHPLEPFDEVDYMIRSKDRVEPRLEHQSRLRFLLRRYISDQRIHPLVENNLDSSCPMHGAGSSLISPSCEPKIDLLSPK